MSWNRWTPRCIAVAVVVSDIIIVDDHHKHHDDDVGNAQNDRMTMTKFLTVVCLFHLTSSSIRRGNVLHLLGALSRTGKCVHR